VLIAQPTKELINRTVEEELLAIDHPPNYKIFNEDTVARGSSVAREITEYLNNAESAGVIVFATDQILPLIPHIANRQDWHVLVDEEMQVLRQYSHHVPHTHHIITDEIKLRSYNAGYSRVVPRNHASLAEKGRNKGDDEVLTKFAETFRILNNPNWESFVNTAQCSRLIAGEIMTLDFHSVLTPKIFDGFASVFMASANFEDTAIYQLWGDRVSFQRDGQFCNGLECTPWGGQMGKVRIG
jgi:hypothetical protein